MNLQKKKTFFSHLNKACLDKGGKSSNPKAVRRLPAPRKNSRTGSMSKCDA